MVSKLSSAERAQLGLLGFELGEPETLEIAGVDIAEGRGLVATLTLSALVAMGPSEVGYSEVASSVARNAGMKVSIFDQSPSIMRIEDKAGRPLRIWSLRGTEHYREEERPNVARIDASHGPVVVEAGDARLAIATEGNRIMLHPITKGEEGATTQIAIRAPLMEWTLNCSDDWMIRELKARAGSTDPWIQTAGAGIHARLLEPGSADELRACVDRALKGEVDDNLLHARRWARSLNAQQLQGLEELALRHIEALFRTLDELDLDMAPSNQAWRENFRHACLERDDLEAVRLLLVEAGAASEVHNALDALDRRWFDFVDTLPIIVTFDDERLRRVSLGDPEAWWAEPAARWTEPVSQENVERKKETPSVSASTLVRKPNDPRPWTVVREVDQFGIPELDLAGPPARFWDDEPRSAPYPLELGVDRNRTLPVPGPSQLLAALPQGDNWAAMTRRSVARLAAWFLVCEDRQARLRAQEVATLAHQTSLVRHVLEQPNLSRVLIADEVGLGKTVEAGLIIKELLRVRQNCRVLYLAPARLVRNVRNEFQRLELPFRQWVSGGDADANLSDNWIIASIHRAVHEAHFESVVGTPPWDVLIVDECHHLSDWQAGGGKPVRQYQLVKELIDRMPENSRVILMSGTPHQGHPERFDNLLRLLRRPGEPEAALAGRVIYRTKDDVRDWEGNPLFPMRQVNQPTLVDLGPAHREWLEHIYEFYVPSAATGNGDAKKRAAGWRTALALQWASSSVQAGLGFLVRQALRVDWQLDRPALCAAIEAIRPYRLGSVTEPLDQVFARISREVERQRTDDDVDDIEEEAPGDSAWRPNHAALASLLEEGTDLAHSLGDHKWERIYEEVLSDAGDEKVVLFAQPIETVTALAGFLERRTGSKPALIVGAQSQEERDREIESFWKSDGPQFLVSSRAGGEGINLQVARRLIHVDVPWNPMEMEQRVGRVHRFGSRRKILVDTIVSRQSREVDMYRVAREKLFTIASKMVPEDRFDALFARVMSLVPPEELQAIMGGRPLTPLSTQEESQLRDLVSRGFSDWNDFHKRYSGEKIQALDPGCADWPDFARFLERHAGGRPVEGSQALRFLWEEGEVREASRVAKVLRLGDASYAFGDYGGLPVTDEEGKRVALAGLNVSFIADVLRSRGFPSEAVGAAHIRWPEGVPLPEGIGKLPFGVWITARRSLRLGNGTPVEVGTEIHVIAIASSGEEFTLQADAKARMVRTIIDGTVRAKAEDAPQLVDRIRDAELRWVRALQRPSDEDRAARVYHAVTPILGTIVS